mmetsp:Transcript_27596/g.46739  ORF Transcript_27596/g.46739 Transcript_27596/m.46739 type:complete len:213 (+) Transcript_27596:183-821(+)
MWNNNRPPSMEPGRNNPVNPASSQQRQQTQQEMWRQMQYAMMKQQQQQRHMMEEQKKRMEMEEKRRRAAEQQRQFFREEQDRQADDIKRSHEILYNLKELVKLSPYELYRMFIIPHITRLALEKANVRNLLIQKGGIRWAEARANEFARGQRRPTIECSTVERELRALETRIILKLTYPGDFEAGIRSICERQPKLAASTLPKLRSFLGRPY